MAKWLSNAVFYNIYPQSFHDTNGDGIGDLRGITEKLDYIKGMGFDAIWLNPFYASSFRDAGYDVIDYCKVAPRYGTLEDFREMCEEAHRRGIHVVVDLVAGHTSVDSEWFKMSQKAEKNEYTNRYVWTNDWLDCPPDFIAGVSERNGCYLKNFFTTQPALNYGYAKVDDPTWQLPMDHPDCIATKKALVDIMEFWIANGCDGFRVDMAASLVKNDADKRGILAFWQEIRKLFDEKYPECVLISEWSDPHLAIRAGFHIDFLIHFNHPAYTQLFRAEPGRSVNRDFVGRSFFSKDGNGSFEAFLEDYLPEYEATRGKGYVSMPTGNHDFQRMSYLRSEKEIQVAYAFLFTMPGVPFVYYGDEIGMHYIPDLPSKEGGYTRTGSRTPMQWTNGRNAGFSDGAAEDLYLPVETGESIPNVAAQEKDESSLLNWTKKLIALRHSAPALQADGEVEFLNRKNGGYPLIYRRTLGTDAYTICINPTGFEKSFPLTGKYETALKNDAVCVENGSVSLPPVSFAILKEI